MKKLGFFLFLLVTCFNHLGVQAQDEIAWSYKFDSETSTLLMKAQLKEHWHLYSQFNDENAGPVPTAFTFNTSGEIQLIDSVLEPEAIAIYDENFEADLLIFENEVVFKQLLEVKSSGTITGQILYMLCDDHGCLPPALENFTITIDFISAN